MKKTCRLGLASGFSLVEMLILLALFAIIALLGYPALLRTLERVKMESFLRQAANNLRASRLEAIKRGQPAVSWADFRGERLVSYLDLDDSRTLTADDRELASLALPPAIGFWGPPDASAELTNAVEGFEEDATDGGWVEFRPTGAATRVGSVRFSDGRGNFLELRVAPAATGHVQIRKYDPNDAVTPWREQGQGGKAWDWY